MRRHTAPLAGMLAAGALILAACGTDTSGGAGHDGHAAVTGTNNRADVTFARTMIPHHRQAIAMARLADRKAGPGVRRLAAAIESAQGPEIARMSGWLRAWRVPVPSPAVTGQNADPDTGRDMSHDMDHGSGMMSAAEMDRLRRASGRDFDRAFLTLMIEHHRGAVTMARAETRHGADPRAVALAQSIITAQQAEITKMRRMLAAG